MMTVKNAGLSGRIARALASRASWYFVFGLFALQAVWFAASAAYPMAFDERYHFGLIQLHAQQWLPFFTSQPPTGMYGAVVRDPSYLYHWLMSLPYRSIAVFTHNQTTQIILLRLVNVAFFAYALILFRRLMRRVGVSAALTNVSLLLFTLIPVVPFLAATINYDNLLTVVVPWTVLLTLDVLAAFRGYRVPLARLGVLVAVLLLGALVKYPFLPVAVVTVLFLLWHAWRQKLFDTAVWRTAWADFRRLSGVRQLLVVVLLALAFGLFAERYGVNMVRYHVPVPKCDQAISQRECMEYGPRGRDYGLEQAKPADFHPNPVRYTGSWLYGMWFRLFFAVGPEPVFDTRAPLFAVGRVAIGAAVLLALGVAVRFRRLFAARPERVLLLLIMLGYGLALFADNFAEYVDTAAPVAINGRYWVPFLPLFFGLSGLAWAQLLRRRPAIKTAAAMLTLAVFVLQGGGVMTYIVRSNDNWYWPNATLRRMNGDIRRVISPIVFGKQLPRPKA